MMTVGVSVLQKMSDWLETLLQVFMSHVTRVRVLEEVTAAIAVLVDEGNSLRFPFGCDISFSHNPYLSLYFKFTILIAPYFPSSPFRFVCNDTCYAGVEW